MIITVKYADAKRKPNKNAGLNRNFFSFLFATALVVCTTMMIIHLFILSSAFQMYEFSYIHFQQMNILVVTIYHEDHSSLVNHHIEVLNIVNLNMSYQPVIKQLTLKTMFTFISLLRNKATINTNGRVEW